MKKSSGSGTLGRYSNVLLILVRRQLCISMTLIIHRRRNWKKRYFVLRGKTITYYAEDDLESVKPLGVIELSDVT